MRAYISTGNLNTSKKIIDLFAFTIEKLGTYESHKDEIFFCQLNVSEGSGKEALLTVVNEIGCHFLGTTFKPEAMLSQMLNIVEAEEAIDANGEIDPDVILKLIVSRFAADQTTDPILVQIDGEDPGDQRDPDPEWFSVPGEERKAGQRVKRGLERRVRKRTIVKGKDRRLESDGRREVDDPKISSW